MSVELSKIETALLKGDLSRLTDDERLSYYHKVCESTGLNPLTQPFSYITLNGKLVLYAMRAATDQLRKIYNVSIVITTREKFDDIYVVTAQAILPDGRKDESTGAVNIKGLTGDVLANAFLKCETKAKRRVTLSICGLGLLDETEVDTIPGAKIEHHELPKALEEYTKEEFKAEVMKTIVQTSVTDLVSPLTPEYEKLISNLQITGGKLGGTKIGDAWRFREGVAKEFAAQIIKKQDGGGKLSDLENAFVEYGFSKGLIKQQELNA